MPRRMTATLAASGPMASTPADTVLAWADTFRLPKSLATAANSFLKRSALAGDIMPAARSIDVFPAVPTSAAIALGRGLMREAQPSLRIYDREGNTYTFAVEINRCA